MNISGPPEEIPGPSAVFKWVDILAEWVRVKYAELARNHPSIYSALVGTHLLL